MGLGIKSVLGKSVLKALKSTGIVVGSVAAVAAGSALQDANLIQQIWASTGPVAPIAVFLLAVAGGALKDLVKHRDKI